jgi:hypothetical protein
MDGIKLNTEDIIMAMMKNNENKLSLGPVKHDVETSYFSFSCSLSMTSDGS